MRLNSPDQEVACSSWAPRGLHNDALGWQTGDLDKQLEIQAQAPAPQWGWFKEQGNHSFRSREQPQIPKLPTALAEHKKQHQNQVSGTFLFTELTQETRFLQILDLLLPCWSQSEFCPWLWEGTVSDWLNCEPTPDRWTKMEVWMPWSRKYQNQPC